MIHPVAGAYELPEVIIMSVLATVQYTPYQSFRHDQH